MDFPDSKAGLRQEIRTLRGELENIATEKDAEIIQLRAENRHLNVQLKRALKHRVQTADFGGGNVKL